MEQDLDTLAKRVKFVRQEKGLTQAQLGKMIGADPSVIGNLERRNGKSSSYTEALAKALGVNLSWLMSGSGDKQSENGQELKDSQVKQNDYVVVGGKTDYALVEVPYKDLKASCGGGYVNLEHPEQKGMIAFTVEFLRENDLPIDGKGLLLMHACGDSMGYTIPHGTLMLVNTNESEYDNFISNKIYVFNADGESICKRAFKNLDGTVTLVSDNADKIRYPDQIVNKDKFYDFSMEARVRYTFSKQ
ncbi:XRE family transcriptional regulator [Psychrobacter namhaensis]|jgi:phage repressor protein C with HTH and peptisase S24 domain|uniref:XRE family transcriptional regulator n=1 Tax=Psychrobacter namhaensis TaxID=292734 RepID=A0ABW8LCP4_9GAMM